jgi:hypothetical protein
VNEARLSAKVPSSRLILFSAGATSDGVRGGRMGMGVGAGGSSIGMPSYRDIAIVDQYRVLRSLENAS